MDCVVLVSNIKDINIFHFFALEIWVVWDTVCKYKNISFILYLTDYEDNGVHRWRKDLSSAFVPTFTNKENMCKYIHDKKLSVTKVIDLPYHGWMIDAWSFVKYPKSDYWISFADTIKNNLQLPVTLHGTYATFVTRKKSRVLYDVETKTLFETIFRQTCLQHKIPFIVACFDEMTLHEQAVIVSKTKVMLSCHGAGNTNVFFLPSNGHLMEINFRKHWYCDPVCKLHSTGELPYTCKCDGKLTYRPYFHKADYHNLAHLFGKQYTELSIEDGEGFIDNNPINITKLYIDGNYVIKMMLSAMQS